MGKTTAGLIIAITFFGAFLRLWNLNEQSYWIDEGYTVNTISSIMRGDGLILKSGIISHDSMYGYAGALSSLFLGSEPWVYRLPALCAGFFLIILIFIIARDLFDKRVALLSAFFISFSYWQIAWSRQARGYTLLTFFFWLSLWSFHRCLRGERRWLYGGITLVSTACALLTHRLAYLLPVIFIVWAIAYCGRTCTRRHEWWVIGCCAFAIVVLSDYLLGFGFLSVIFHSVNIGYYAPYYLQFTVREYGFFLILFFIGLPWIHSSWRKSLVLISIPFLVSSGILSFFFGGDLINYRYLFFVTPVLSILGAVGIYSSYDFLKGRQAIIFFTSAVILFFIVGGGVVIPRQLYWLESDDITRFREWWREYYSYTPQPNFAEAYAFIRERRVGDQPIISTHAVFNDIYLGEPGYWLKSSLNYFDTSDGNYLKVNNDRDFYVGARVIDTPLELREIVSRGGFVVFDYLSLHGRVGSEMFEYVMKYGRLVYEHQYNPVSKIWVYAF